MPCRRRPARGGFSRGRRRKRILLPVFDHRVSTKVSWSGTYFAPACIEKYHPWQGKASQELREDMRSRNMALQAYLELAPPGSVCRETCRAGERRSCHCASHAAASSVGGGQRVLLPPQQAPPQIELRLALQRDRREELRSPGRTSQSENFADRDRPTYLHPGFRAPPPSLRTRVLDHPAQGARGQGIMPGPTGTPCRSDQFPRPHCTWRHPPPLAPASTAEDHLSNPSALRPLPRPIPASSLALLPSRVPVTSNGM